MQSLLQLDHLHFQVFVFFLVTGEELVRLELLVAWTIATSKDKSSILKEGKYMNFFYTKVDVTYPIPVDHDSVSENVTLSILALSAFSRWKHASRSLFNIFMTSFSLLISSLKRLSFWTMDTISSDCGAK